MNSSVNTIRFPTPVCYEIVSGLRIVHSTLTQLKNSPPSGILLQTGW